MLHDFSVTMFLDVISMAMATISFLYLQNVFLWSISKWLVIPELIDTFLLWVLFKKLTYVLSCNYVPRSGCLALHEVIPDWKITKMDIGILLWNVGIACGSMRWRYYYRLQDCYDLVICKEWKRVPDLVFVIVRKKLAKNRNARKSLIKTRD